MKADLRLPMDGDEVIGGYVWAPSCVIDAATVRACFTIIFTKRRSQFVRSNKRATRDRLQVLYTSKSALRDVVDRQVCRMFAVDEVGASRLKSKGPSSPRLTLYLLHVSALLQPASLSGQHRMILHMYDSIATFSSCNIERFAEIPSIIVAFCFLLV